MSSQQLENFLTVEHFRLAFQHLQTASRGLYKNFYYEDLKIFGSFLDENIESLIQDIKENIFQPESAYKIFKPKKNNLVRPLSLLKFKDLLVYQAIVNIIVTIVYEDIEPYYNHIIFGNQIYNPNLNNKDRIFFFRPWKQQWKKFGEKTKEYYESGYNFVSEFDIASFFDTIDHWILQQILETQYNIDRTITAFLVELLEAYTSDVIKNNFKSRHGIPQGPIASAFLADLYLLYLDLEIDRFKTQKFDIRYIRYVDDIRIFSKDEFTAQKAIAYLDLLARDLGLIPQADKIFVKKIENIDDLIRHQKSKFSAINREYKAKGGYLKSKTHKNQKKRFLHCFTTNIQEEYLDKTVISFSLYKLNKDEEIKNVLLRHWESLYIHFEGILFYFSKHFSEDSEVLKWLVEILHNDNILFHYFIGLIFKFFPEIDFFEDVYYRYMIKKSRHWIVQYFMLSWLYENKKYELIQNFESENYFLNREATSLKFKIMEDMISLKIIAKSLLKDEDCLVALQGAYCLPRHIFVSTLFSNPNDSDYNHYIAHIISSENKVDYLQHILKQNFLIENSNNFFNAQIWTDPDTYQELKLSFRLFIQNQQIDPLKALSNLNIFHNLVYDKICEILSLSKPHPDYGCNLDAKVIVDHFPITNSFFIKINTDRNQKTEAHPYDKHGNLRKRITRQELKRLTERQKISLQEICNFNFLDYL